MHRSMSGQQKKGDTGLDLSSDEENVEEAELVEVEESNVEAESVDVENIGGCEKAEQEAEKCQIKVKMPKPRTHASSDSKSGKAASTSKPSRIEGKSKHKDPHGSLPQDTAAAKTPKKPLMSTSGREEPKDVDATL